jgi:hypothetical protein
VAKTVILSVNDGMWNRWGDQFVKAQPQARKQLLISATPTVDQTKTSILNAIREAGSGGTLIISVGHGGAGTGSTFEGMVDLAPAGVMRLGGANAAVPPNFVSVFYDINLAGPPSASGLDNDLKLNPGSARLKNWRVYQEISNAFKQTGVREVVLLSCNVGNSIDFVKKIANDWRVIVRAYKVQVGVDPNPPRFKVFLANRPPPYRTAAESILHEEYLPFAPADTILVGPPL